MQPLKMTIFIIKSRFGKSVFTVCVYKCTCQENQKNGQSYVNCGYL